MVLIAKVAVGRWMTTRFEERQCKNSTGNGCSTAIMHCWAHGIT